MQLDHKNILAFVALLALLVFAPRIIGWAGEWNPLRLLHRTLGVSEERNLVVLGTLILMLLAGVKRRAS